MKREVWRPLILVVMAAVYVTACATPGVAPPPMDIQPVPSGKYQQKADYLYFILDASSSMGEWTTGGREKFAQAKTVLERMNMTLPDLKVDGGLRSFGHSINLSRSRTLLHYGMTGYTQAGFQGGLDKVTRPGGTTPMLPATGSTITAAISPG